MREEEENHIVHLTRSERERTSFSSSQLYKRSFESKSSLSLSVILDEKDSLWVQREENIKWRTSFEWMKMEKNEVFATHSKHYW